MNKAIISAGLLLCLAGAAQAQMKTNYPATGKTLPAAPPAAEPVKPTYWSSYFDDMYDDSIDVTAAANARNTDELSRDGWNKHHNTKIKPTDKAKDDKPKDGKETK